jgi:hypothetical protein
MLKLPISDLLAYVVIILQYVVLCYSVVDLNSIACGGKSSVILNLLLDKIDSVFLCYIGQKLSTLACECGMYCYPACTGVMQRLIKYKYCI